MADKSCIHCGHPAGSDSDVVTRAGVVHEGCWAAYSGDNDSQAIVSRPMQFLGAVLRFLGMIVICVAALNLLFGDRDAETIIIVLIAGSFGAAMHFAGRKIAPDARWASAAGGALVGVGSIAAVVVAISGLLFVLGLVFAFLSMFN
jgi:hypothetical protein